MLKTVIKVGRSYRTRAGDRTFEITDTIGESDSLFGQGYRFWGTSTIDIDSTHKRTDTLAFLSLGQRGAVRDAMASEDLVREIVAEPRAINVQEISVGDVVGMIDIKDGIKDGTFNGRIKDGLLFGWTETVSKFAISDDQYAGLVGYDNRKLRDGTVVVVSFDRFDMVSDHVDLVGTVLVTYRVPGSSLYFLEALRSPIKPE